MKRAALSAFTLSTLALLALAPEARAEVPKYDALTNGAVTTLPTRDAPAFIPANEKVPGLFVVSQKHSPETPAESRYITVVGDAKAADNIVSGRGFDPDDADLGTCFTQSHRGARSKKGKAAQVEEDDESDVDPDSEEWATSQMWQVNLWPKGRNNPSGGVTAVHGERVMTVDGKTALESVDAWVDPQTRGARLIARTSLPLTLVGSAIGGVKVFAARDARPGRTLVEFVVVSAKRSTSSRGNVMMGMRQDGQNMHGSGCGHLRMPLAVSAAGDAGVIVAPVELPDLPKTDEPAETADAKAKEPGAEPKAVAEPAKSPPPASAGKRFGPKAILKRVVRKPTPEPAAPSSPPVERELRTRDMQIHLSVSKTSADTQPVLAVSFGWAGRESVQRVFEPSSGPMFGE